MRQSNWIALTIVAVVGLAICTALWVVFVDRDEAPGATGSVQGTETAPSVTPVTPETPGRTP